MSSYNDPAVIMSGGPVRVDTSQPDPEFKPRPVGFTAAETIAAVERAVEKLKAVGQPSARLDMPLLWEGDQA